MLTLCFIGLVSLALLLVVWEIWQVFNAHPPRRPEVLRVVGETRSPQPIPKIIWTYWHCAPEPEVVARCHANWRRYCPDHELRLLHADNSQQWLAPGQDFAARAQLPAFRQADWLRLQLLARHGGIWIDASTMLTVSLDWVHRIQAEQQAEFVGFFIDRYTRDTARPMVENWFMAAAPGSRFIADWARELEQALQMGECAYIEMLRQSGELDDAAQGLADDVKMREYLVMHVAASRVMKRDFSGYRLALRRAEDSALAYLAALRWRKRHFYARMALTRCPLKVPCLIKLRGGDRQLFDQQLALGHVRAGSMLARYLPPA